MVSSEPMLWVVRLSTFLKASDACIVHHLIEAAIRCEDFIDDLYPVDLLSNVEMPVSRAGAQSLGRTRAPSLSRRSVSQTRAPSATNACAMATPMPRDAPVTNAVLPLNRK